MTVEHNKGLSCVLFKFRLLGSSPQLSRSGCLTKKRNFTVMGVKLILAPHKQVMQLLRTHTNHLLVHYGIVTMLVTIDQSLLKLLLTFFKVWRIRTLKLLPSFSSSWACHDVSQIPDWGSVWSISSWASVLRDLIYSAVRLQISNQAAQNSLPVAKTNININTTKATR